MSLRVKNCCLCLPLRTGLLIWGYFALIMIYASILLILYRLRVLLNAPGPWDPAEFVYTCFGLTGIAMYFIFHVVLVAGLHKDSSGLIAAYKGSILITMILGGIAAALYIPLSMFRIYQAIDISYSDILYVELLKFLFHAVLMVAVVFLLKLYLLECVRTMISTLGDDEGNCLSEQPARNPDYDSDV